MLPVVSGANQSAIERNLAIYTQAARGAFSENTARAIRSDLRIFIEWASSADRSADIPVEPETVAAFIDGLSGTRAPATVRRYVASLNHLHRAAGLIPPGSAEIVRLAVRRMNRAKSTKQDQAAPLRHTSISKMLAALPQDTGGRRDAALITLAYDSLLRRSEISALNVEDIERDAETGTALVRRSKTDQEGEGDYVFLSAETMRLLAEWIEAAAIETGALFRPLSRAAKRDRLTGGDIARVLKRRAKAAGIDPKLISGHSTRVGAAQDMRAAGLDLGAIMQAGRWESPRMVQRYTARLGVRFGAAARLAEIQGR
ncbi:MAG: site-specific integrase [Pseudomonadota bacterium]